ncbi:MAG: hypothetical protein GEU90_16525 [Gemmatimonas sp.]|nr:hypothetical protein [Gemmatimonas sp.]
MALRHLIELRGRRIIAPVLCLLVSACSGGTDAPDTQVATDGEYSTFSGGPPGGVLVALLDGEPDDLNPLTYSSYPANQAIHLMFRSLARRDSTLSGYQPDLATSWEMRDDSVLVLTLREDVNWHDGVPVTADDVAFTIDRQRDPVVASPRQADVAAVEEVTVVDSTTVEVQMRRTGAYAVNALLEVIPVPKHLLQDAEPADIRLAPFGQNPVGNGFYRFGRWERGQQLVLDVNSEVPEGRAALDRIILRVVPDINAALTELLAGQGDLLRVPSEHSDRVRASGATELYVAPRVRPAWIAWNTDSPPLDDQSVRQALLMGIDREAIARGLFGEVGEVAPSPIPPTLWEHSEDVEPIAYDPAGARALLEQAGWHDTDADGVRERDGRPLRIEVDFISADPVRRDVLVAIQSMLSEIGVDLVPRAYERTAWVERLRSREFQGSSWGWGWGPGVVGPNAETVFHSRSIPPAGANFAGASNPRADALIDEILATSDTIRLRQLWREFEQLAIDDAVYAPLYLDPELFGLHSRFENVRFRGIEWWEDVPYWYVPLDRRLPRDRTQ